MFSAIYVSISILVLFNSIIHQHKDSVFYFFDSPWIEVFRPGFMLGLTLGFGGGNGFVLMGQALTFLVFFLMMKYVIGRIKNVK